MRRGDRDWIALHLTTGIGERKKKSLLEQFDRPSKILRMSVVEVVKATGCREESARRFVGSVAASVAEAERVGTTGILRLADEEYPPLLREIYDPPTVLFYRGNVSLLRKPTIAIVGARKADRGAAGWTVSIAETLARSGFLIASGMARGIDGAAHRGALDGGGGTVAVLGTGPDIVYPPEHGKLMKQIVENGLLLTEFPPGMEPRAQSFPRRNRIIAGLSCAVVIVQAAGRSGAMITARLALQEGRDLFVLAAPPWDPRFAGNGRLARDGAAVVQDGEEIALLLGVTPAGKQMEIVFHLEELDGEERLVAETLTDGERSADQICRKTEIAPARVLNTLLSLELNGYVEERPGNRYTLVRRAWTG